MTPPEFLETSVIRMPRDLDTVSGRERVTRCLVVSILTLLLAVPTPAIAGSAADKSSSSFSLYTDQDVLLIPGMPWLNDDRNYTQGIAFKFAGPTLRRRFLPHLLVASLSWLDRATGLERLHRLPEFDPTGAIGESETEGRLVSLAGDGVLIGGSAFTPNKYQRRAPILDDRPFASLTFVSVSHASIDTVNRDALVTELTVGMLGLRLASQAQAAIHRGAPPVIDRTGLPPRGWANQISDGGEATAKYTIRYLREFARETTLGVDWDLSTSIEANIGYYTGIAPGAMLRVGRIRTEFWMVDVNPIGSANQALDSSHSQREFELYLWTAARERFVGYNALLQGQFKDNPHSLQPDEIRRAVIEWDTGITAGKGGHSLTYAVGVRTAEMEIGEPRSHAWGAIYYTHRSVGSRE